MTHKELEGAIRDKSLDEQREILEQYMKANTDEDVLEGIRFAAEFAAQEQVTYEVTSHVED